MEKQVVLRETIRPPSTGGASVELEWRSGEDGFTIAVQNPDAPLPLMHIDVIVRALHEFRKQVLRESGGGAARK